jgi:predicted transcriptional regulator
MNTVHFLVKPLLDLFDRLRAVTMPEMKAALGTRADVTVFRKLSTLPYRSSYSDRGRFYTLDSIAHFDAHGLWCCREACFSQHGTLLETTEAFVQAAPAGCFAHELASQLHVPVKDALRHLVQRGRLHRQRCGDLYLYTAPDRTRRKAQLALRHVQAQADEAAPEPLRAAIVLFYSLLDEQQRRLYAGLESLKQGHGGDRQMAQRLGLDADTVARGRQELLTGAIERQRVRRSGGGRPRAEKKRPNS